MFSADLILKNAIRRVFHEGVPSEQARPVYSDGSTANSLYVTGYYQEYDLAKGEFPITELRPISWKSAIKEILWIYQMGSNKLEDLRAMGVNYWDAWDIGDGTIGKRYGYTVYKYNLINRLLEQLDDNPWNRRNVISLWDYESFDESEGLLPCAFQVMFDVRKVNGQMYLDCTLTQRSNDLLVAHHINAIQYVALQMMIAKHFCWKVGKFHYFVNNLHIYDNQFGQAEDLLFRPSKFNEVELRLNCADGTSFFDITIDDFELVGYEPTKPNLKFDLAI